MAARKTWHRSVVWLMVAWALFLSEPPAFARGARRNTSPPRTLMLKYRVPLHRCTACGQKVSFAIQKVPGVLGTRVSHIDDVAVVFIEDGRAVPEDVAGAIQRIGFHAELVWGPAAATVDGRPEPISEKEMPRVRPVPRQIWAERAEGDRLAPAARGAEGAKSMVGDEREFAVGHPNVRAPASPFAPLGGSGIPAAAASSKSSATRERARIPAERAPRDSDAGAYEAPSNEPLPLTEEQLRRSQ